MEAARPGSPRLLILFVSDPMPSFLPPVASRLRSSILFVPALVLCWAAALQPFASAQRANRSPEPLQDVGVEQRLGASLPQSLTFRNEAGESVPLRTYFDGETPVMLTLNYHRCPQLCRIQLQKFARALGGLEWTAGDTYTVVTVDISPDEGPAIARKAKADGWHFLTGERPAIQALADSVGIRYKRLQNKEHQFAHPAAIVFLSGSGTITRYFTTLSPSSGNVRTALVEASNGTVGTLVDKAFLACARFDPDANSYSASAFKIMRYGSVFAALLLGAVLFVFWRREKKQLDTAQEAGIEGLVNERT
jgi:protein SCO1/2